MNPDRCDDGWKDLKASLGSSWEEWRDRMLDNFASIIFDAGITCVGIVVDAEGYRRALLSPECHLSHKDSNVFSFHHIIMRGIETIAIVDQHSPIGIVIDDDPQNIKAYYDLLNGLRIHPDPCFEAVKRRVNAITFCKDDDYPGLQAADMVVYEVRALARRMAADKTSTPSELLLKLTHAGMHSPHFFDGVNIMKLGRNVKAAIEREQHP